MRFYTVTRKAIKQMIGKEKLHFEQLIGLNIHHPLLGCDILILLCWDQRNGAIIRGDQLGITQIGFGLFPGGFRGIVIGLSLVEILLGHDFVLA
ncbi:Uncharacterised protein [Vibrio cholerae]|nr:Uncharacterised protein [Vibrio cholerae]